MAEGAGFEPAAQGLPVHGISSAAPSAARSPLLRDSTRAVAHRNGGGERICTPEGPSGPLSDFESDAFNRARPPLRTSIVSSLSRISLFAPNASNCGVSVLSKFHSAHGARGDHGGRRCDFLDGFYKCPGRQVRVPLNHAQPSPAAPRLDRSPDYRSSDETRSERVARSACYVTPSIRPASSSWAAAQRVARTVRARRESRGRPVPPPPPLPWCVRRASNEIAQRAGGVREIPVVRTPGSRTRATVGSRRGSVAHR